MENLPDRFKVQNCNFSRNPTSRYQTGNAAEIGVYKGHFSAENLMHWPGNFSYLYYMVDAWSFRPNDDPNDKNFRDDASNDKKYRLDDL